MISLIPDFQSMEEYLDKVKALVDDLKGKDTILLNQVILEPNVPNHQGLILFRSLYLMSYIYPVGISSGYLVGRPQASIRYSPGTISSPKVVTSRNSRDRSQGVTLA
jgi:hypothetical protein